MKREYYHLKGTYGITNQDKLIMYIDQSLQCAICGKDFRSINDAHVDHDHETEKVRGLVHVKCNTFIGFIERNKDLLVKTFEYTGLLSKIHKSINKYYGGRSNDDISDMLSSDSFGESLE